MLERNGNSKVRVVLVDDSIQYRAIICRLVENHPRIEVVGEAVNGIEALALILKLKPDVVLMDLEMPLMDGMTALQHLMIHIPTPIIMFSRLTKEGTARCFDALKNGAVHFYSKDHLHASASLESFKQALVEKVLSAAALKINAIEPVFPKEHSKPGIKKKVKTLVFCEECGSKEELTVFENEDQGGVICTFCGEYISLEQRNKYRRANCLSVIFADKSGYINLLKLIPRLRQDINGIVLVIIDSSVKHVSAFTQYLNDISTVNIIRAKNNLSLQGGNCYIGSSRENIIMKPNSAAHKLVKLAKPGGVQLPVDTVLRSVVEIFKERSIGVFISGKKIRLGEGLIKIFENKGRVVVLDPVRCMNKHMTTSILKTQNPIIAGDEVELAEMISEIHFHYRDTIITT